MSLPTKVDILVGSVLPNLDFVEIGFCFLTTGLLVVFLAGLLVGRVVVLTAG